MNIEEKIGDEVMDGEFVESLQHNISKYIKELIIAGKDDSIIKAMVIAQMLAIGFITDNPDTLDDEIASIRKKMETGKGQNKKGK